MIHDIVDTRFLWRPDLLRVIERQHAWLEGKRKFLVTVIPAAWNSFDWDLSIDVPTPRLIETFDFTDDGQLDEYLSFRLTQFESYWQRKAEWGLDDDFLPVFEPRLGWAEVVAPMVEGAEVRYYAQTSAMHPVIDNWETFDWSRIRFNPESRDGKILSRANQWAAEHGKGRFLVQPRGTDANPSDFAKACRGDALFLDFYNDPDAVHQLLERCTRATIELIEYQRQVVGGQTLGGYGTTWHGGYWTSGNVLGHVGDNVADLISGAMYEEFLAPYMRKILAHFGGGVFARDVTTRQIWGSIRGLGNVLAFKPRNMGTTRVTPDDIRIISAKTNGLPLYLEPLNLGEFHEFRQVVRETGIRAFFVAHCQTHEEGARVLDHVRQME